MDLITADFIIIILIETLVLYPQFIDDPGLMNDEKLKPIKLPLSHLSGLKTTTTCKRRYPPLLPKSHDILPPYEIYGDAEICVQSAVGCVSS